MGGPHPGQVDLARPGIHLDLGHLRAEVVSEVWPALAGFERPVDVGHAPASVGGEDHPHLAGVAHHLLKRHRLFARPDILFALARDLRHLAAQQVCGGARDLAVQPLGSHARGVAAHHRLARSDGRARFQRGAGIRTQHVDTLRAQAERLGGDQRVDGAGALAVVGQAGGEGQAAVVVDRERAAG